MSDTDKTRECDICHVRYREDIAATNRFFCSCGGVLLPFLDAPPTQPEGTASFIPSKEMRECPNCKQMVPVNCCHWPCCPPAPLASEAPPQSLAAPAGETLTKATDDEKRDMLKERGWSLWYSQNYWVHPKTVKNPAEQDHTMYGMTLDRAYQYEINNEPPRPMVMGPEFWAATGTEAGMGMRIGMLEKTVKMLEASEAARMEHICELEAEVARLAADREALTMPLQPRMTLPRVWFDPEGPDGETSRWIVIHHENDYATADEALAAYHASRSTTTEKNTNG